MTQPFTTAELDAIIKEAEIQSRLTGYVAASLFDRMADAARASIPRPIAEAPMDGTLIDVWTESGKRYTDVKYDEGEWWFETDDLHMQMAIREPLVSFLPIPKGGAS